MSERKATDSQSIWDVHEWGAGSEHHELLDAGETADDLWEDGAEWPATPTRLSVGSKLQPLEVPAGGDEETPPKDASSPKAADEDDLESEDDEVSAAPESNAGDKGSEPKTDAEDDKAEDTAEETHVKAEDTAEETHVKAEDTAEEAEDASVETTSEAKKAGDAEAQGADSSDSSDSSEGNDDLLEGSENKETWGGSDQDWAKSDWDLNAVESDVQPAEESTSSASGAVKSGMREASKDKVRGANRGKLPEPGWVASFEGVRGYILVFVFALLVFSTLFGKRIGQISSDPHYVLLADSFLKNRWYLDSAPIHPYSKKRMTNDWAQMDVIKVTRLNGKPLPKVTQLRGWWRSHSGTRRVFSTLSQKYTVETKDIRAQRRFYFVSFPPLPAYLMMGPMWLLGKMGYDRTRFSDITFSLFFAALAVLLLFWLLQALSASGQSLRTCYENLQLTTLFAFGSVFFFVAAQGTVWFTALVVGVCCSLAFLIASHYDKPLLAGVFVAAGFLTRPLLVLLSLFFLWQVVYKNRRWESPFVPANLRKLVLFALPVGLTILGMMMFNQMRFGAPMEFGHAYLPAVFGRVEKYGLFHTHWLPRNFFAFFLATPDFNMIGKAIALKAKVGGTSVMSGKMSLLSFVRIWTILLIALTLFVLYRSFEMRTQEDKQDVWFWGAGLSLLVLAALPLYLRWVPFPKINAHGLSLFITTPALLFLLIPMVNPTKNRDPWFWGLLGTALIITIPLLMYQNTGWLTFGKRFSMDYMPLLIVALATSGIVFGRLWRLLLLVAVVINAFGAISFGRAWQLYHHNIHSLDWIYSIKWINSLFS